MAASAEGAARRQIEPGAREDQIAERRRSLLEATISVIGRDGLTGLTMKAVAEAAGCSYGVAAFHFRSKEGLLLAAYEQLLEDYETIRLARANTTAQGAERAICRLRAMVDSDFDGETTSVRQMAVFIAFWAESVRNEAYRERCATVKARYNASAEQEIAALARAQGREVDARQAAVTLNAICDGYWIANIVSGNTGPEGCRMGRSACLAYLDTLFPGCFTETSPASPSSASDTRPPK